MPYSGDPNNSDADTVRFLLQDTDANAHDLTDAEVAFLLDTYTTPARAALQGARILMSKFGKDVDKQVGDLEIRASERAKRYRDIVDQLETVVSSLAPTEVYVGGLSRDEELDDELDDDLPEPFFKRDMHTFDTGRVHDSVTRDDL